MQPHIRRKLSKEERLALVEAGREDRNTSVLRACKEEKCKLVDMVFAPLWHNTSLRSIILLYLC
jgi:hypothetical protein